ncbi:MAG: hypothetical protein U0U70_07315 [Chitinophagaceae bacterium]
MSVFIILLALSARIIQLLFYLDSFFDTTFQVIATENLTKGHGVSTAIVQAADLSAPLYQPLINWPPGYSLLLYPFYIICGHNYLIACFIIDILAAAAIILLTRRILSLLDLPVWLINLYTLLTGFFIYYFYYTGSTDSISIAFFLGAITTLLGLVKMKGRWIRPAVTAGLCLFLSASLKYLYFPVVFTIPVFFFLYGYQNKLAGIRKASLLILGIVAAGIGILYMYQKSIAGSGTYISSTGRGIYPEQLLRMHPLLPASFVTLNSLRKLPVVPRDHIIDIFRIVSLLLLVTLIVIGTKAFLRTGFKQASLQKTFLYLTLKLCVAITVVLVLLSLFVYREIIPPDRWWTYVEDARYYGLADIMIHLSVFLLFYHYRKKASGFLKKFLLVLPFLLVPEAIRGFTFTAIRVLKSGKEKYYWQQEGEFQGYAARIVNQKKDSLHVQRAVVSGSLYYANYRASVHQQIPVLEDLAALNEPSALKTKEPVILLVIIDEKATGGFSGFINNPATELAGKLNGFYFYTLYVTP